jgi:hypothetical protein
MAYVAETGASGDVICAYPSGNPIGNGVAFSQYFYADQLGEGYYPTDTSFVHIRGQLTGLPDNPDQPVQLYALQQNYPNPFNPVTTISYVLPKAMHVRLEIYDITGRLVETLVDSPELSGEHQVQWNARGMSSGVYFYKLSSGTLTSRMKKMILLK